MLFANVVEEIQSIIDRTDYSLSITYLDEDSNLSSVTDRICRERKPLGIIFLGGSREDFSEDTSSFKVPCVIVTTSAENWSMEELSSVSIDDEKAGGNNRRLSHRAWTYKDSRDWSQSGAFTDSSSAT